MLNFGGVNFWIVSIASFAQLKHESPMKANQRILNFAHLTHSFPFDITNDDIKTTFHQMILKF